MQSTVESMMVAQAEESMQKFLAWAKQRCMEFKQVWSLQNCSLHDLDCCHVSDLGTIWAHYIYRCSLFACKPCTCLTGDRLQLCFTLWHQCYPVKFAAKAEEMTVHHLGQKHAMHSTMIASTN